MKEYDYTQAGENFIAQVTWQQESLPGEVVHGEIDLSGAGKIVQEEGFKTGQIRLNVELNVGDFIVMPNHVHGIIWIMATTDSDFLLTQNPCCIILEPPGEHCQLSLTA